MARQPGQHPETGTGYALAMIGRRRFLEVLAALGVSQTLPSRATDRKVSFASYPFPLGVASGYPSPGSVILWTRLTGGLDPLAVRVRWELATDESMKSIISSGETIAEPAWAHSVHVEVPGLEPERWYWYRFSAGDARSAVGRTRTAPAAADRGPDTAAPGPPPGAGGARAHSPGGRPVPPGRSTDPRPLPPRMRPEGPNMRIYTRAGWGQPARFSLLDDRQYRSWHACPR